MSHLLLALLGIPAPLMLAVIGVLVFAEAAFFLGFVLPGETAVLMGGFLASTGHLPLLPLAVTAVLAAVAGDSVGYEVGRRFGTRLLATRPLRAQQHRVDRAQAFLAGRGASAIFVARSTAFLRAVTPGLAGLSRMRYRRFFAFNALGGLVWGVGAALLGYFAGSSFLQVAQWMGRSGAIIVGVLVVVGILLWRRSRSRRHAEPQVVAEPSTRERSPGQPDPVV